MARWEPNAQERLARAALELFHERGYDQATVADITERAGLTRRTFFRYYADKREVLFGNQDAMTRQFVDTIAAVPPEATPIDAVAAALDAVGGTTFTSELHEFAGLRRGVVAASDELRERELLKGAKLVAGMAEALGKRGVPDSAARLAAEMAGLAFSMAYQRWSEPGNRKEFAAIAREALAELTAAAAGFSPPAAAPGR